MAIEEWEWSAQLTDRLHRKRAWRESPIRSEKSLPGYRLAF